MPTLLLALTNLASAQAVHAVDVTDAGYDPVDLIILQDDTIEWTFVGNANHSVTSDAGGAATFDSGVLGLGGFFSQAFPTRGVTTYGSTVDAAGFAGSVEVVRFNGLSLNELLADPGTLDGDANCDGVINTTQDEFVELVNDTGAVVDLTGGTISDAIQVRHTFPAATVLQPGGVLLVFGGGTPLFDGTSPSSRPWCLDLSATVQVQVASGGLLGLNNTGDDIVVRDVNGDPLDSFSYGAEGDSDESLVRTTELTRTVMIQHTTTPLATTWSPGTDIDGNAFGGVAGIGLTEFSPGMAGVQNSVTVTGGPANTAGSLVIGFNAGNTAFPGGACAGVTMGIQSPKKVSNRNTNANGEATFTISIPAGAAGRSMLAQVIFPSTCEVSTVSITAF